MTEVAYHADGFAEIREMLEMSQQELAGRLGTSQSAISRYERAMDRPSVEEMLKLVELTGCSVAALIDRCFEVRRTRDAEVA